MKEINDEIQMLEVKKGNLDAMVPLFDKYHKRIYNFFLRVTKDSTSSEDLAQTVFSRMLSYRRSYNDIYPFKTWMYQIARNVHIDHYSKPGPELYYSEKSEHLVSEEREAIEKMDRDQKEETLREALGLLSPEQREIIEMSRFQDLRYEEIAGITGNSVGAIRVKVHRAIQRLKDIYFQIA
ncbi:MAG: RNA polymerase sigma factor [Bacteroidales bacterium]|nr:RNA polymerase sigma factor [Bacteroidales bacterium]